MPIIIETVFNIIGNILGEGVLFFNVTILTIDYAFIYFRNAFFLAIAILNFLYTKFYGYYGIIFTEPFLTRINL